MKVLIIQEFFPIYRQSFFDEIYKNHDLTVIVSNDPFFDINAERRSYIKELGPIHKIFKGNLFWFKGLLSYNFKEFDIIVLSAAPRNLSFLILMFYLKLINKKTVFWGQHWSFTSTKLGYLLRMLLLKLATSVLFYTEKECLDYKKTLLGRNDKRIIRGLNNGLNINNISKHRSLFDINSRIYNIFFIGRLSNKSNIQLLMEAIQKSKYSLNIKLHIIGDGELILKCKEFVANSDLTKQVIFYGSIKEEKHIAEIANKCCFFVYTGAVGLSLIHAMAYGLPCIIHNNYNTHGPEISALIESQGGKFYEKNNLSSLVKVIDFYLSNKELLVEHSQNNIKLVTETYNSIDMYNRFNSLVEDTIND